MQTLKEQIENKCKHFTGIMDKACKVGVLYDDVKDKSVKPFKFPCIYKECDSCIKREYLTEQEVNETIKEIEDDGTWAIKVLSFLQTIKTHSSGVINCPACGAYVEWIRSGYNGHHAANCLGCKRSFIE